jgi:hypothetical protein
MAYQPHGFLSDAPVDDSMVEGSSRRIHGVDFSGAQDAGEKIWISSGNIEGDSLVVEECRSAVDEFETTDREAILRGLREFISDRSESAFGLDFSFGVPREIADDDDWNTFVQSFSKHTDVESMQNEYSEQARQLSDTDGVHLKRETDEKWKARSPYGFITRSQTFYGIGTILAPLVRDELVSVLPMQEGKSDRPWVLEIYPAATLDSLSLNREGYKDNTIESRERRMQNPEGIVAEEVEVDECVRERAICTDDALDSLVAAFATFRTVRDGPPAVDETSHPEGHIYV